MFNWSMVRRAAVGYALVSVVAACACDCGPGGETFLSVAGFDQVAESQFPDYTVEVCVEEFACHTEKPIDDDQLIELRELGYSDQVVSPMFTVSLFVDGGTTTLDQDDFVVETRTSSGCCPSRFHVISLDT